MVINLDYRWNGSKAVHSSPNIACVPAVVGQAIMKKQDTVDDSLVLFGPVRILSKLAQESVVGHSIYCSLFKYKNINVHNTLASQKTARQAL